MKKNMVLVLTFLALILLAAYFMLSERNMPPKKIELAKINGFILPKSREIQDFHLTDHTGKAFTKAELKGHWTFLFFGFTNCPMICPTTMASLNKMYQLLEKEIPKEYLPEVVMISVDPEEDSSARMQSYVTAFNPHFKGARGDIVETENLEKELHIAAIKMQLPKQDKETKERYTINHSAEILVFNPEGKLQAYLSYPHEPKKMAKDYQVLLLNASV